MMQLSSRDRARNPRTVGCGSEKILARNVASLSALEAATLRQRWKALFVTDPSPRVGCHPQKLNDSHAARAKRLYSW
jgi:hypothetical protein